MSEDPWKYATYEGTERLQHENAKKMSLSERLDVLDGMLRFAETLKESSPVVAEEQASYNADDSHSSES